MAIFEAELYQRHRPLYPIETFLKLRAFLEKRFTSPFDVADIAAGTGNASLSLLRSGISVRIHAVEPSAEMLEYARASETLQNAGALFSQGSGEATGLPPQSFNAVMVASAFHWMDRAKAKEEFLRILRTGGILQIFEYQFPKCTTRPEVNEYIKAGFNQRWKAPGQVPRGNFRELTQDLREDSRLHELSFEQVPMSLELSLQELTGLLLSQSRVLHFERTLSAVAQLEFREGLSENLGKLLAAGAEARTRFDFKLTVVIFEKTSGRALNGEELK
ncbi:MAG: class I SAM-dependent methyltransferase [Methylotenera sp.]|nr:class I SAM-dependent methyltransferase [Oligoflexia bacterium]